MNPSPTSLAPDRDAHRAAGPAGHRALAELHRGPTGHSLLPGGFGRALMAVAPWSPMVVRGEGWRVWDDTGRELIDLNANFTTNVHGNAHPHIVEAVTQAAQAGLSFGMPNRHELTNARMLLERFVGLDEVRFTNSGTEATQLAARIARARTGREKVVVVRGSYHGWSETVLPTGGPSARRGVPQGMWDATIVVPFNDVEALTATVGSQPGSIAAVFLDLLPNRVGMQQVSLDYIREAERLCRAHGIALVVDEVISFRLHVGGLTTARSVAADMVCLGKTMGGGLPVGAVVGKADWMEELNPLRPDGLEHGGTFSANPLSMAAGVASLELLDAAAVARIGRLGDRLRSHLGEPLTSHGWEPRGIGSLTRIFPAHAAADPSAVVELQRQLWWACYERGLTLAKHGVTAISTVMDDDVIDRCAAILADAVAAVATGSTMAARP